MNQEKNNKGYIGSSIDLMILLDSYSINNKSKIVEICYTKENVK